MATKSKKATKKAAPKKTASKQRTISDYTVRECIRENKMLKMHVTIITILSIAVCALVFALVIKDK